MRSDRETQKRWIRTGLFTAFGVIALLAVSGENARADERPAPRVTFAKPATSTIDPERHSAREVVVKFHEGTHVRLRDRRLSFDPAWLTDDDRERLARHDLLPDLVRADVRTANEVFFGRADSMVQPLFARSETELDADRARYQGAAREELADLNLYVVLVLPEPDRAFAEATINRLNELRAVEISYAEPLPADPAADIAPPTGINIVADQGYKLDPAQNGIDAAWANRIPGGRGTDVRVIDVESGWDKDHEDLPGSYFTEHGWNFAEGSHGAAVLGVLAAADNGYGATGIVPEVALGLSSPIWSTAFAPHDTAAAVDNAAAELRLGDILVVEQHYDLPRPPGATCVDNCDQFGYLPAESVQGVYDAIRLATAKGVVVVEAAGNGSMNLDHPFYSNRFNRSVRDSGAIMVGAGSEIDRTAYVWSNFGSRVDMQGWGGSVATLGYGKDPSLRANGGDARQWYTRAFGGTSSATPIVAGAAAAVNGTRRGYGDPPLDAIGMRQWLRATGTAQPSANATTNQIGPLPDLSRAIQAVGGALERVRPDGVAVGWKFHSGQPAISNGVDFFVDGPAGSGTFAGTATANVGRTDINHRYQISGSHGFEYRIPDIFRNDAPHTLHALGKDPTGRGRNVALANPVTFNLPNVRGMIDSIYAAGRVRGWAYAAQSPSQSINVRAYVDGPATGGGTLIGTYPTTVNRPDVNAAFGIVGDHGLDFEIPAAYRDGRKHTLYLHGVDPRGINDAVLAMREFTFVPVPSVSPRTLEFGWRAVGSRTVQSARLTNSGAAFLEIGAITISGGPFLLDGTTCAGTLDAGATCDIGIAYRPTSTGHSSGLVAVATPNATNASILIGLDAVADIAKAELDATLLALGPVNVGAHTTQTVRLSNTGNVPVTVASMSLSGSTVFSHTNCRSIIPLDGFCEVTVTFAPVATGSRGAWLRFHDDAGGPHEVWLEGAGVPVGIPTPSPASLSFGSAVVGTKLVVFTTTLYNTGGAPLDVYHAQIVKPHLDDFRIVTNGCPNGTVLALASFGCKITVAFTPQASGPRQAKLSISTSNGTATVSLAGTGTAPLVRTHWRAFGFVAAHGGWNTAEAGIDTQTVTGLHDLWKTSTPAAVLTSPAVDANTVVFGAADGVIRAVDPVSGAARWQYPTGGAVHSSPAMAGGLVVVGSDDGRVYALHLQSGTLAWSFATNGAVSSAPAVADGMVFAGSRDGRIYALDLATGAMIWSDSLGAPVLASPAVADHVLFVGADNNRLRAFEAARGAVLWTVSTNGPVRSAPTVAMGKVFAGSLGGGIYAFDVLTGSQLWFRPTNSPVRSSPAYAYGFLYVGTDNDLIAFDAAGGALVWGLPNRATHSAPAVANGIAYVATVDGYLRAFDAWSGSELKALDRQIVGSSPAIANATVYVGTDSGVVALQR